MPIPAFRPDGYLPEGVHAATEAEVAARFGLVTPRREFLMERLHNTDSRQYKGVGWTYASNP